jgi:glycine/D-amino acid oxidase-like deaminating enzyme
MKAIVIGAGVVGTSVAYHLAKKGVDVTVLERDYVGAGTSGTTFAWTNANRKPPRPYYELNRAGMAGHIALRDQLKGDWFRVTGNVEWYHDESDRRVHQERVERLLSWGYDARWISIRELGELEADIDLSVVRDAPIAFYPDEGLVDPVRFAAYLMREAAQRHKARIVLGVRIARLERSGGRIVRALSDSGDVYEGDIFVNCTGRWINDITAQNPDLFIPTAPTAGMLIFTPPAPTTLSRPVHAPDVNIRPDGAGRLMLRSNEGDENVTFESPRDPMTPAVIKIMNAARKLLPCLGNMKAEAVRIALRSIPADDLTVIGTLPGIDGYYVCMTHSGVTLAPVLGQITANEITNSNLATTLNLEPFRPHRFAMRKAG